MINVVVIIGVFWIFIGLMVFTYVGANTYVVAWFFCCIFIFCVVNVCCELCNVRNIFGCVFEDYIFVVILFLFVFV